MKQPPMSNKIKTKIKDKALIEKKRRIIIKAANKLFIKKGFHKTSISEIARESGLTQGTLYNYIRQKEDILFLLHEDLQKKVIEQIELGIKKGTDIQNRIETLFINILELLDKYKQTSRVVFIETASQTKISLKILLTRESEIIKKICELISTGVEQKIFYVKDERLTASIIHYLIFYPSLNTWDIKSMGIANSEVKKSILSYIYRILGYKESGKGI